MPVHFYRAKQCLGENSIKGFDGADKVTALGLVPALQSGLTGASSQRAPQSTGSITHWEKQKSYFF